MSLRMITLRSTISVSMGSNNSAFPAIGAGVGGLSEEESAKAIVEGIAHYARAAQSVKEITLVGLNKYVCDCFCKAVNECKE